MRMSLVKTFFLFLLVFILPWKMRIKSTKIEVYIPKSNPYLDKNSKDVSEADVDSEYLNENKNITIAITSFSVAESSSDGLISYEEMEEMEVLEMFNHQFWKARRVSDGRVGKIDRNDFAIGKGLSLFNYKSEMENANYFVKIRKGESFLLLIKNMTEYWYGMSENTKSKGFIHEVPLIIVPFSYNKTKPLGAENHCPIQVVKSIKDFDGSLFKGFLSISDGEELCVLEKFNAHTWLALSRSSNEVGLVPSFLFKNPNKLFVSKRPVFRDSRKNVFLKQAKEFISYKKGDTLNVTRTSHPTIWLAKTKNERGFILKKDIIDQCNDGFVCGDVCVPFTRIFQRNFTCQCGNGSILPYEDDFMTYCCIHPKDSCTENRDVVNCSSGIIKESLYPCHGVCHGDYSFADFPSTFTCKNAKNECIKTPQMCQGVDWCGETEYCNNNIRCPHIDKNTFMKYFLRREYDSIVSSSIVQKQQHLRSNLINEHYFCKNYDTKLVGNNMYDWLDRSDEQIVKSQKINKIDFSYIQDCRDDFGREGKTCYYNKNNYTCIPIWCIKDFGSCLVGENKTYIQTNDEELCQNNTFWKSFNCSTHEKTG